MSARARSASTEATAAGRVRTCLLLNGRAAAFPADPEVAAARGMHHELPDQLAVDHLLGPR